jgi:hypothetical protein
MPRLRSSMSAHRAVWDDTSRNRVVGRLAALLLGALSQLALLGSALGEPIEAEPPAAADTPIPHAGLDRFDGPRLVSNGTTFLEAWITEHVEHTEYEPPYSGVSYRLFSAADDALETVRDGALDAGEASWVDAVSVGGDYYIFWSSPLASSPGEYLPARVVRIDGETGEILAENAVAFADDPDVGVSRLDAILAGDDGAILLWLDEGLFMATLDTDDLTVQGDGPTQLLSLPAEEIPVLLSAARSGDRLLVAYVLMENTGYYQYTYRLYADLFDLESSSLESSLFIAEYENFVGSDPWGGLIVTYPWQSVSIGEDGERFALFCVLSAAGWLLESSSFAATYVLDAQTGDVLNVSDMDAFICPPRCDEALARVGDRYLAACAGPESDDDETISVETVVLDRGTGAPLSAANTVTSEGVFSFDVPRALVSGDQFLVGWQEGADAPYYGGDLRGAFVDLDGQVAAPGGMTVAERNNSELRPALAIGGEHDLLVWMDGRNPESGDFDIYGARLGADGMSLDPDALPIGTGAGDQRDPAIASNGSGYLVVWQTEPTESASVRGIWGALVNGATGQLDAGGAFEIPTVYEGRNPRVAARPGGDEYLVTFDDVRQEEDSSWTWGVFGLWVNAASGEIMSPEPFLVGRADDAINGDLAWTGSGFLSVLLDEGGAVVKVKALLVDAESETPEEATPVLLGSAGQTYSTSVPRATVLGDTAFVAWLDSTEVMLADLDLLTGEPSSDQTLGECTAGDATSPPAITTDGEGVLVVWACRRADGTKPDLEAVRVNGAGEVVDAEPVALDPSGEGWMPALAGGAEGIVMAHVMELPHVWRVVTRRLTVSDYLVTDDAGTGDPGADSGADSGEADSGAIGGASSKGSCTCSPAAQGARPSLLSLLLQAVSPSM